MSRFTIIKTQIEDIEALRAVCAEIQAVFLNAMFAAFETDAEPTDLHVAQVLTDFVPLSKLMAESIATLRA